MEMINEHRYKMVECVECGCEIQVSKFASAKIAKCADCKAASKHKAVGPVKGTKEWAIDKFRKAENVYDTFQPAIDRAVEDGIVKSGFNAVYGVHRQYSWRWMYGLLMEKSPCRLYGSGRKSAKVWDYEYHAAQLHKEREKAFEELEKKGARFTWDEWIAGRFGVIGNAGLDYYIENYMEDEIQCLINSGDDGRSIAMMSISDNYHDEYCDYCRKHGHERMY